jgi:hypothetical protein
MDSFNINSAIQQGNAMTRANAEHNETVRIARQKIDTDYNASKAKNKSNQAWDQHVFEGEDTLSSINLGMKAGVFSDSWKQLRGTNGSPESFWSQQRAMARERNPKFHGVSQATGTDAGKSAAGDKDGGPTTESSPDPEPDYNAPSKPLSGDAAQPITHPDNPNHPEPEPEQDLRQSGVIGDDADPSRSAVESQPKTNETSVANEDSTPARTSVASGDLTGDTDKLVSAGAETSTIESLAQKGIETAGKVAPFMRIAGNVGGYVDDFDLLKDGFHANASGGWGKAAEWMSGAGALLDTIGIAVPILEPLGAVLNIGGAIASSVETHKDDVATAQSTDDAHTAALKGQKFTNTGALSNMGLIANQNTHIANQSGASGSF